MEQKIKDKIKDIFLKKDYVKNQFFVVVTDEPLSVVTEKELKKRITLIYDFEDFLRMVEKYE